jgi:O-antigen/teichoic acid export membrane protein
LLTASELVTPKQPNPASEASYGRRIARNSVLNLCTGAAVMCLSLIFVPLMLHAFGTELYGVLSVTWMVLGYFSWLDFGFGRASARFVARELALGRPDEAASWAWTAIITQACLGLCGGVLLSILTPLLVSLLHVQAQNMRLVAATLQLFAFSIPLTLATRSLNGVLEAAQRFDWINALNLVSSLLTYAVYGIGALQGANFSFVIYGLFALRFVALAGSYWGAMRVLPGLRSPVAIKRLKSGYGSHARAMIAYGSWVTVAAVVGPMLLTFDQWMIGIIMGVALLPFYSVPFNVLGRLSIFPSSISSTLFPAFSSLHAANNWEKIEFYFLRAHRYLLIILIPISFMLFTWGGEILRLWVGPEFALQGATPLRILVVGFGIGLLAPFSGALLEGIGRPDIVAKLYLVELPFNVGAVYLLTTRFGLAGAALSYTLRAFVETVMMWLVAYRVMPLSFKKFAITTFLRPGLAALSLGIAASVIRSPRLGSYFDVIGTALSLAIYGMVTATLILDNTDKSLILRFYRARQPDTA